ncbi:MAG TPA: patatin-like phospholipase family protein [Thermoanaerobaculia bacterium]|nr:patatin-like phospholipase family protein [Thermoanaerobaculia bacterium]
MRDEAVSAAVAGSPGTGGVALVLSGGGARAAYQVGVLRALARRRPDLRVPVVTGVSAGAINAALLACHPGSFREAVEVLSTLWAGLEVERVFRVDTRSLASHLLRWSFRLVSGGGAFAPQVRGLVDTAPLRELLVDALGAAPDGALPGVARALEAGRLRSLAVITSGYSTGQSVVWVAGREVESWERPDRRSVPARITVDHVMASAALPLFFPAVRLGHAWHGDGGIRLATPLAPAIHLGADRILAISTRYRRTLPEADRPTSVGYPPPLQIAGQLLNAIFLDMLDQDCLRVERLNLLLRELPEEKRHGLRPIDVQAIRPSRDLGALAAELEPRLPRAFRSLTRGLGSRETSRPDLLSLLMFQGEYTRRLMDIGEADGEERIAELERLVDRA